MMKTPFYFVTVHKDRPIMQPAGLPTDCPLTRRIELFHGDCLAGMRLLTPGSVEVCVTSPPYNIGVKYDHYEDDQHVAGYLTWLESVLALLKEVIAEDGSLFLNLGGPPSDPMKPFDIIRECAGGWTVQNVIHWVKAISLGDEPVRGHVKPVNSARYLNGQHEYVFHLTQNGGVKLDKLAVGVPYADTSNLTRGSRGKNGNLRDRGNVWYLPYDTIQSRDRDRPHPASFPVALAERCIRLHGLERTRTVLDPFIGIGTTGVAAARLGLHGIGYDLSEPYIDEAARRVVEEVRQANFPEVKRHG